MPKPKIMRVITRLNVGGPALHVLLLAEGLEARGYETVLVAGACEAEQGDRPMEVPAGRRVVTVEGLSRSISPWRDLRAAWRMYRLMRRERPGIVHTHTAKAGLVGRIAALAAGVPAIVHTFHGNSLSGYFSPRMNSLLCAIERLLARATDPICVVSEQQLEELSGRFRIAPRGKFRVVPLGLDLAREFELPLPAPQHGALRVGWLGRLVEIKGVPLLAAVIEESIRQGVAAQFLIGGDGPDRNILENVSARYGAERVRWTGWEPDATRMIAQCDLLIQTSRNEGTPVALIQGMAAGRAFVSTAVGGVVDLVSGPQLRAGSGCRWFANGVLTDPDAGAFARALRDFAADPALVPRMGAAARAFAGERFRAERLVNDIDRLYRELGAARSAAQPGAAPELTGESQCDC
jgi:glycosyltransferase involved in cell wall biosynthesis